MVETHIHYVRPEDEEQANSNMKYDLVVIGIDIGALKYAISKIGYNISLDTYHLLRSEVFGNASLAKKKQTKIEKIRLLMDHLQSLENMFTPDVDMIVIENQIDQLVGNRFARTKAANGGIMREIQTCTMTRLDAFIDRTKTTIDGVSAKSKCTNLKIKQGDENSWTAPKQCTYEQRKEWMRQFLFDSFSPAHPSFFGASPEDGLTLQRALKCNNEVTYDFCDSIGHGISAIQRRLKLKKKRKMDSSGKKKKNDTDVRRRSSEEPTVDAGDKEVH